MNKMKLTIEVLQTEDEHPVEPADLMRAVIHIRPMVEGGSLMGKGTFNVPHSHMGESDNARYNIYWTIEDN